MNLCNRHDCAYEAVECPACKLEEELDDAKLETGFREDEIEDLKKEIEELKGQQ